MSFVGTGNSGVEMDKILSKYINMDDDSLRQELDNLTRVNYLRNMFLEYVQTAVKHAKLHENEDAVYSDYLEDMKRLLGKVNQDIEYVEFAEKQILVALALHAGILENIED